MKRVLRHRRGLTLLEAVISMFILVTGLAALFGLVNNVQNANQSLAFQNNALDILARLSAQIHDARCDYIAGTDPTNQTNWSVDPGLWGGAVPPGVWVGAAGPVAPDSGITIVGSSELAAPNNPLRGYVPPMRVDYRVTNVSGPAPSPPVLQYDIRVREVTRDSANLAAGGSANRDDEAVVGGYWMRVFQVQKFCSPRLDPQGRGEY